MLPKAVLLLDLAFLACLATATGYARAEVYTVCYVRPNDTQETITICPVHVDEMTGTPCQCPTDAPKVGEIYEIEIVSTKRILAENPVMCSVGVLAKRRLTLCADYGSTENTCACVDRGQLEGRSYKILLLADKQEALPEARNPLAHADFLTRLRECCIKK
jgi:hypothetical protein